MRTVPSDDHSRVTSPCICCGSTSFAHHLTGWDYHYGAAGEFTSVRCEGCGLVRIDPMLRADQLALLYPQDYYSFRSPELPGAVKQAIKRVIGLGRRTLLPRFEKAGVMLDVGCGAGQYLLEMRHRGWQVFGSELSSQAAQAGRAVGLDIRSGELTDAGFESGMFDFVRLNHSFEHIPNPGEILDEIRRIIKPTGWLFIGVPNSAGLMAKLFGRYWWYVGLPVHTYTYNPANLRGLLARHGFHTEKVRFHSDYGGVLGSVQILLNRNSAPRTSDGRVIRSAALRLPAQYLARTLDFLRAGDCIELLARPGEVARP